MVVKNTEGAIMRGRLLHFARHAAIFEVGGPDDTMRTSEVLPSCEVFVDNRMLFTGKGVVANLVGVNGSLTCEVSLDGDWLSDEEETAALAIRIKSSFEDFLMSWQKSYRILPEYKLVVADIQTFLCDLRIWLDKVEMDLRSQPADSRAQAELDVAFRLRSEVGPALENMFARFESVCEKLEDGAHPAHRAYSQRQLHSLILCAPFIHRTYTKPLGYAGDYEMMNMIVRNGMEGNSLYAKLVNAYLLDQVGPQAVRNRVHYLSGKIFDETSRIASSGRSANIYCIACGPAWEARNFVTDSALADLARFELLDFNEETLLHTRQRMDEARRKHNRKTEVKYVKSSVQSLLVGKTKPMERSGYDLIYCSGLYDYLNDRIIRMLNGFLYDQLTPGGLLVVGNFAPCTPVRNFIEHLLEWFLIYRNGQQLAALAPAQADPDDCRVVAEPTGANIFLEVRKPQ